MSEHLIPLTCPACGARIKSSKGSLRAVCEYCGTENYPFNYQPNLEQSFERPPIPLPASVTMKQFSKGVRITRRWFSWKVFPMAFFCLFWDGFLCFWYSMVLSSNAPIVFAIFPLIHLAVGVVITYSTLAMFLNRSVIEIAAKTLEVYHEPLPWVGEIKISIHELRQLYCIQKIHHGKNGQSITYDLQAATLDGHSKTLLKGLDSPDVALYLEQQIESWLKIEDRPVGGELPRQMEIYPAG